MHSHGRHPLAVLPFQRESGMGSIRPGGTPRIPIALLLCLAALRMAYRMLRSTERGTRRAEGGAGSFVAAALSRRSPPMPAA